MVAEPDLMLELARRRDGLAEESVLRLAVHLRNPETARTAFLVAAARDGIDELREARLVELHEVVQLVFADPLVGPEAENLVARHRSEAAQLVGSPGALVRVEEAPREYVMSQPPAVIARHVDLLSRWEGRGSKRILVGLGSAPPGEGWWLDVVASDRHGLLARVAGVLAALGYDVARALAVTWPGGPALESFLVRGAAEPDVLQLRSAFEAAVDGPLVTEPVDGAEVVFDDSASPWYTICEVRAPDSPGLLGAIAGAFAAAGVDVHGAAVTTVQGVATDRFEVNHRGTRLTPAARAEVRHNLAHGVELPGRRSLGGRLADRGRAALGSVTRQPPVADTTSHTH